MFASLQLWDPLSISMFLRYLWVTWFSLLFSSWRSLLTLVTFAVHIFNRLFFLSPAFSLCFSYFSQWWENTWHLQIKGGKIYFGSRLLEVSVHSWASPKQGGKTKGHHRRRTVQSVAGRSMLQDFWALPPTPKLAVDIIHTHNCAKPISGII